MQFQNKFGLHFEGAEKPEIDASFYPLAPFVKRNDTTEIPRFDKSFIVMARSLLNTIYSMKNSAHVTDYAGVLRSFRRICSAIASREAAGH